MKTHLSRFGENKRREEHHDSTSGVVVTVYCIQTSLNT